MSVEYFKCPKCRKRRRNLTLRENAERLIGVMRKAYGKLLTIRTDQRFLREKYIQQARTIDVIANAVERLANDTF